MKRTYIELDPQLQGQIGSAALAAGVELTPNPGVIAYTIDDIRAAVSRSAFEKAQDYARMGKVVAFSVEDDGHTIIARTLGSGRFPYDQDIYVEPQPDGHVDFEGTCSCPMNFNCKHVAAALLEALRARPRRTFIDGAGGTPRPLQPALPPQIAGWIGSLDAAVRADSDEYPPDEDLRVFYLLSASDKTERVPHLQVKPVSAIPRADGSIPPNGVPVDLGFGHRMVGPAHIRPVDRWILRRLEGHSWSNGEHVLRNDEAGETLSRILATGRARWWGNAAPLREGPARPGRLVWTLKPNGEQTLTVDLEKGLRALRMKPPWYVDVKAGVLGPLQIEMAPSLSAALLEAPNVPPAAVGRVRELIAGKLGDRAPLPVVMSKPEKLRAQPTPHLRFMRGELPPNTSARASRDGLRAPAGVAEVSFRYGPIAVAMSPRTPKVVAVHEGKLYSVPRDLPMEADAVRRLHAAGVKAAGEVFAWATPEEHRMHFVPAHDEDGLAWARILHRDVPALRAEGWSIEIDDDFPLRIARTDGDFDAELKEGSGIDWFDLELGAVVEGVRVDLAPVLIAYLGRKTADKAAGPEAEELFVPLEDGRLLALPSAKVRPILAALAALFRGGGRDDERVRFSLMDAADLAALEEATAQAGVRWRGGEALRKLGAKLRDVGGIPATKVPRTFKAKLRPYQRRGVDWLQFLRDVGFGGVLADDMGLGKTVQTLAHLLVEKSSGRMDRPSLIVCPTSLVANWRMEAQRFAPSLSVLALHGPERKARFDEIAAHDVVITTYPLLSRDHEALTAQPWHAAILDEAQMIKNPDALTAKLAGRLDARQRLCLSGTPLENHLGELWSVFSFAAPGFLGERRMFNSRYRNPIEKLGDTERRTALAQRVRPFILRRTKDQVLTDLPPKTDIQEAVEMNDGQRALYEAIRLTMHARVREAIAKAGLARSHITILDALLKLRQVCCDPRLVKLETPQRKKWALPPPSAKLDRVLEMVPSMIEEGRRILLFSQFTSMLALIEEALREREIDYALLTGDTRDRPAQIERFQKGKVDLFLISLKAGGQGLNLTAADTIILYDPWWNPAVEDQAAGRAHRIGQTKPVFVHKMMTVGTIEEKMEELKARKRELVAGILDGALGTKLSLSESDIEALFAP